MQYRKKKVEIIYGYEAITLKDNLNNFLGKFENPNDIISVQYSGNSALVLYWED